MPRERTAGRFEQKVGHRHRYTDYRSIKDVAYSMARRSGKSIEDRDSFERRAANR